MSAVPKRWLVKFAAAALSSLFSLLPVKNNKVFLFSYYGSQYGCNPKYITEYILRHYPGGYFDVVWAFHDVDKCKSASGIRKVRTMSLKYFYELCTSKIIITNFRTTEVYRKRKNQHYIQTWHSSLRLKQIEQDAEDSLPRHYVEMAKEDSQKCDLLLSGSKHSTAIFKRAFWYGGKIFEQGTPRNDILFRENSKLKREVMEKLNINPDSKLILYAPTFRKDGGLEHYNLDYESLLRMLTEKHGGEWKFLVKLHPHLAAQSKLLSFEENVADVSDYDDIQELLSVADILISDYSSLMFDFSITKRPCFLYVPDIETYMQEDRKLYFNLSELPFPSAENNVELVNQIEAFNNEHYHNQLHAFLNQIGSFEQGDACEALLQHIEEVCFGRKRRNLDEAV